jgi:hypothetical protein
MRREFAVPVVFECMADAAGTRRMCAHPPPRVCRSRCSRRATRVTRSFSSSASSSIASSRDTSPTRPPGHRSPECAVDRDRASTESSPSFRVVADRDRVRCHSFAHEHVAREQKELRRRSQAGGRGSPGLPRSVARTGIGSTCGNYGWRPGGSARHWCDGARAQEGGQACG